MDLPQHFGLSRIWCAYSSSIHLKMILSSKDYKKNGVPFGVLFLLSHISRWFHLILTIKRIVCYFVCLLTFHTFEYELIFLSLSKEWCAICCAFPHFTYLKLISSSFDYEKNCVLFDVLTHLTYIWRWYHHLKTFKRMVCYLVCFLPFTYLKIISSSFDY